MSNWKKWQLLFNSVALNLLFPTLVRTSKIVVCGKELDMLFIIETHPDKELAFCEQYIGFFYMQESPFNYLKVSYTFNHKIYVSYHFVAFKQKQQFLLLSTLDLTHPLSLNHMELRPKLNPAYS
jgi:hypothetical protein